MFSQARARIHWKGCGVVEIGDELTREGVDLIAVSTTPFANRLMNASSTPILFVEGYGPIGQGVVASIARTRSQCNTFHRQRWNWPRGSGWSWSH